MLNQTKDKKPTAEEIQKEFEEFIKQKYGGTVRFVQQPSSSIELDQQNTQKQKLADLFSKHTYIFVFCFLFANCLTRSLVVSVIPRGVNSTPKKQMPQGKALQAKAQHSRITGTGRTNKPHLRSKFLGLLARRPIAPTTCQQVGHRPHQVPPTRLHSRLNNNNYCASINVRPN